MYIYECMYIYISMECKYVTYKVRLRFEHEQLHEVVI